MPRKFVSKADTEARAALTRLKAFVGIHASSLAHDKQQVLQSDLLAVEDGLRRQEKKGAPRKLVDKDWRLAMAELKTAMGLGQEARDLKEISDRHTQEGLSLVQLAVMQRFSEMVDDLPAPVLMQAMLAFGRGAGAVQDRNPPEGVGQEPPTVRVRLPGERVLEIGRADRKDKDNEQMVDAFADDEPPVDDEPDAGIQLA